jgi:hypothetical protein
MSGARQAPAMSDDGASQAANSLVEFIDRLLRQAFGDAFVLEWTAKYYPAETKMTFVDNQGTRVRQRGLKLSASRMEANLVEQASSFHRLSNPSRVTANLEEDPWQKSSRSTRTVQGDSVSGSRPETGRSSPPGVLQNQGGCPEGHRIRGEQRAVSRRGFDRKDRK